VPAGGELPDALEWHVDEDFRHRVGCGLTTAVLLPIWFGLMALGLGREASSLAVVVATALFASSLAIGIAAFRRIRRLPSVVALDDGWLHIRGRHVDLALPTEALSGVEIGASAGLESVRLSTRQGRTLRLPGDLGDLEGFIDALRRENPAMVVTDHRLAATVDGGREGSGPGHGPAAGRGGPDGAGHGPAGLGPDPELGP
jgi:hypothetical protein